MDKGFKIKFVICFAFVLLLLFGGYFLYSNYKKGELKEESFKFYNEYNFNENSVIKTDLVDDTYLSNLLSLDSYISFDENNLERLMKYYVKNITKNTAEDIRVSDDSLSFNLSKQAFIKSMKELFGIDASDIYNKLNSVYFITANTNRIYFDIDYTMTNNDNEYLLGVKSISKNEDIITIDTYVYSFVVDNKDMEDNLKSSIINSVNTNDFTRINNLIENNYGTYSEKIIRFKQVLDGDYFKYQIVSIQTK